MHPLQDGTPFGPVRSLLTKLGGPPVPVHLPDLRMKSRTCWDTSGVWLSRPRMKHPFTVSHAARHHVFRCAKHVRPQSLVPRLQATLPEVLDQSGPCTLGPVDHDAVRMRRRLVDQRGKRGNGDQIKAFKGCPGCKCEFLGSDPNPGSSDSMFAPFGPELATGSWQLATPLPASPQHP